MRVLILGCGPAGMMAASAADSLGAEIYIASKRARKSLMLGAQYLHERIPGTSAEMFTIDYRLEGTIDGYRRKVYRGESDIEVSPDSLIGCRPAWDIRETYNELWSDYSGAVEHIDASPDHLEGLTKLLLPSIVISTVPAPLLCRSNHQFLYASTYVTESNRPEFTREDNVVVCSGETQTPWSRQSRIQGWENTEYPFAFSSGFEVKKPISTNCDCFPDVVRMGRYGKWTKGVLSHTAYAETLEVIHGWRLR